MVQLSHETAYQKKRPEGTDFKASDHWFAGLAKRNDASLRRKTHTPQKVPEKLETAITMFHGRMLWERRKREFRT